MLLVATREEAYVKEKQNTKKEETYILMGARA